jgi:hypothetical protein
MICFIPLFLFPTPPPLPFPPGGFSRGRVSGVCGSKLLDFQK